MVTLTIDGVEVSVERGDSILDAANKAGVRIPTLCNDKRLIPYGACRLCVVEVTQRGRTRIMPACFNPARDGMVVATHTPALIESRRIELAFLLRSHPLLCPSCDAAGDCELQNLVYEYKVNDLPFPRETRFFHVDNDSHFIRHNMNLCIKCGMCVRICDEVQGQNELSLIQRGLNSEVSTDFGRPLDCEFCGQCASICPVGAIRSRWLVGTGRDFELKRLTTTCAFCSLGCQLTLGLKGDEVVYVTSPPAGPNEGNLCVKGRYGWPYIYSERRLDKPSVRKNGELSPTSWEDAAGYAAGKLKKIISEYGPASVAALGSERITNEEAYVFNRLIRGVIGSPNIDHAGGYAYRAAVDGLMPALGYPAGTNAIREIRKSDVILLVGADLTESHPVAKNEVILATGRHRARAIVIDSMRNKLTERFGEFLGVNPGTEHVLLNGMARYIIDSDLYDKVFVERLTSGFDELKASLADYGLDKVSEITGVPSDSIERTAKEYVEAPLATIILTESMSQISYNVEKAKAAANLALLTGKLGKEGGGIHIFGEKANYQGAIDMGLGPDLLPGHLSISDEAARTKFEAAWSCELSKDLGLSACEILKKAESGEIKALYIVGENPLETYPDKDQVERALSNLELLIVQDIFPTTTAEKAHVVFPAVTFAEKEGTFTGADRLIQRVNAILPIRSGKPDLEIFEIMAAKLGKPFNYSGPAEVMDEIASLVDVYEGVSYFKLALGPVAWPCLEPDDPGKPILYEGGAYPKGKAVFQPAPAKPNAVETGVYIVPTVLKFHSGSFSTWSGSLMDVCPDYQVEMSHNDMKAQGLTENSIIRISADGISVDAKVKKSRRPLDGTIIMAPYFPHLKLNSFLRRETPVTKVKIEKVA